MFVSWFLQSLREGDNMSVKLRVEKAQLVFLLSFSKGINNSMYPQTVDLVYLLLLAWEYILSYFHSHGGVNIN